MAYDRFNVQSFAAVGSLDFENSFITHNNTGLSIQVKADGNFEFNLLADNFGGTPAADVTSLFAGAATITAAGFYWKEGFYPGKVRVNVTSLQSAKHVQVAVGF